MGVEPTGKNMAAVVQRVSMWCCLGRRRNVRNRKKEEGKRVDV